MSLIEIHIPVEGIRSDSPVSSVESALMNVEHVNDVAVDPTAQQVSVVYREGRFEILDFVNAVRESGYAVPLERSLLLIDGMSCASCLAHVEGALEEVPGVVEVKVRLFGGSATVSYIPTVATAEHFKEAVALTGYELKGYSTPEIVPHR